MRTTFGIILSILLICSTSLAADGWALSSPKYASRKVLLTLFIGSQQIQQWTFPVAHDGAPLKDNIQSRWVTLPKEIAKGFPCKVFTDTWLGSVDAHEVWVRFMWWPNKRRDGTERLENSFIIVKFHSKQTQQLGGKMHFEVKYESRG
jgi:hypothetical protein